MGYYSNKEIASVVEPDGLTLANNPNFVVFSGKGDTNRNRQMRASIQIKQTYLLAEDEAVVQRNFRFSVKEKLSGIVHNFKGTCDKSKINNTTFFVAVRGTLAGNTVLSHESANKTTLQNIRECLLKNPFFNNNFDISILATSNEEGAVDLSRGIEIRSKEAGNQYDFEFADCGSYLETTQSDFLFYKQHDLSIPYLTSSAENYWLTIKIKQNTKIIYNRRWSATYNSVNENNNTFLLIPNADTDTYIENFSRSMRNIVKTLSLDAELLKYVDLVVDGPYFIIKDKFNSSQYVVEVEAPMFIIKSHEILSSSFDAIDYGTGDYQIDLEVYTNHGMYPGNKDSLRMGDYVTTLSKSYFGKPLWFDLSALLSKKVSYSPAFLSELELDPKDKNYRLWSKANTMTDYRFVAKRTDGKINEPFYYSSPLYVLNGYDSTLNPLNLKRDEDGNSYVLNFSQDFYTSAFTKVKPLTTRFNHTHIKGQKQYFNFIHNCHLTATRVAGVDNPLPSIGLRYKLYTQMGTFIKEYTYQGQSEDVFDTVNTALLQLDRFLPMHDGKTVGRIDVYLCSWHKSVSLGINKPEVLISTPLSFRILPDHVHEVNDFVFLNRLGGWDTMNFGGGVSSEFKTTGSTIYKTLEPDFNFQTEIESVGIKKIQEQRTAETAPVTADVVEWLREMSASPAVYELKTKRYILIDDMSLKYNSTDDLYRVEMKYHYTDTLK